LVKIASFIKDSIREYDLAARIGGDEFVILCLINNENEVSQIIKRLNETIYIDEANGAKISISTGQACLEPDIECSLESVINRADNKMYENKRSK